MEATIVRCGSTPRRDEIANRQRSSTIDALIDDNGAISEAMPAVAADDPKAIALHIADVLTDTPAADTLVLDIQALSPFADFFVICSGENERQVRAINRQVIEDLAKRAIRPKRTEGNPASGWIVLDYGDVIVHIFDVDQRAFYRLEELWAEAQTLLAIQ